MTKFIAVIHNRIDHCDMYWTGENFSTEKRDALRYSSPNKVKKEFPDSVMKHMEVRPICSKFQYSFAGSNSGSVFVGIEQRAH